MGFPLMMGLGILPMRGDLAETAMKNESVRYLVLLGFICLAYLWTSTDTNLGWIGDGQEMLDTAVSLHEFGDFAIGYSVDPSTGTAVKQEDFGKYGIGYSLVQQVPLFFATSVERTFGGGSSNLPFVLMNLLLTAGTALTVALSMRAMSFPFWCGALAAIGFAFGTFAWAYVTYDFSEPLQALCVSVGYWLL